MKRNAQDGIPNKDSDNNSGFITINELETVLSSDLNKINTDTISELLNNILNTFLRYEKNHLNSRREIEDLRYKVNQSSNPNATAEQALMAISESDREILFDRYLLMKSEEYEQAKLTAERTKVATLSSLNKIRFALNALLSDPVYGPDIKGKIQKIMLNIDPSVEFVQNINLPSYSHTGTGIIGGSDVLNNDVNINRNDQKSNNEDNSSNNDMDLNQLFK